MVTTLLDPKEYTRIDLAELYGLRWHAEIDIKHLKTTMGMEHLPSKTPEIVRETYAFAYYLYKLKQLMVIAGVDNVTMLTNHSNSTANHAIQKGQDYGETDFREIFLKIMMQIK